MIRPAGNNPLEPCGCETLCCEAVPLPTEYVVTVSAPCEPPAEVKLTIPAAMIESAQGGNYGSARTDFDQFHRRMFGG